MPDKRRRLIRRDHDDDRDTGDDRLWLESGSDANMDADVLRRVITEAELVETARARKIERRGD